MRRLLIGLLVAQVGCSESTDMGGEDGGNCAGKCDNADEVNETFEIDNCSIFNASGRGVDPEGLRDPIAQLVLRAGGESCLQSMTDIFAQLDEVDAEGCAGPRTALINEYAQLIGDGSSADARSARSQFRAVTLRGCGGRQEHELAFSTGGRPITRVSDVQQSASNFDDNLPIDVQIIAFDPEPDKETNGVFNYYNLLDGQWNYFGNSRDFTLRGPGPESEDGTPRVRDCALCHTAGDLIMKELDSPWLHWEGQLDGGTPGADKLFDNRPQLGERIGGKGLEDAVGGEKVAGVRKGGFNNHWNPLRVEQMRDWDCNDLCDGRGNSCLDECNADATFALLEPLFCSVQANLANSAESFPERMIVHPLWAPEGEESAFGSFPRPTMNAEEILGYLDDHNSRISTRIAGRFNDTVASGTALRGADGTIRETRFPMVHPVVAEIDVNYVQELLRQDVVSEDFAFDALFVDYSRPLFSSQRCGILQDFVPALPPEQRTKQIIKREFIANMESSSNLSGFEEEFLASLEDSGDTTRHKNDVKAFLEACSVRSGLDPETFAVDEDKSRDFTRDIMALISAVRARGREQMLLLRQFPAAMPTDDAEEDLAGNLAKIELSTSPSTLCQINGLPSSFTP